MLVRLCGERSTYGSFTGIHCIGACDFKTYFSGGGVITHVHTDGECNRVAGSDLHILGEGGRVIGSTNRGSGSQTLAAFIKVNLMRGGKRCDSIVVECERVDGNVSTVGCEIPSSQCYGSSVGRNGHSYW